MRRRRVAPALAMVAIVAAAVAGAPSASGAVRAPSAPAHVSAASRVQSATPYASAASRAPKASHAPARVTTADWEASGENSALASFAALTTIAHGKRTVTLQDIVVQAPISCTDSPTPVIPVDTEVISATVPVNAEGAFRTGSIVRGSGTLINGAITGRKLELTYRHVVRTANQFDGGTEVCDTGNIHVTGAPGHRVTLTDKPWEGQTASGEPVFVNVVAGGRALQEPPHPPANGAAQASIAFGVFTDNCSTDGCTPQSVDICAYAETATLFVAANGAFGNAAYQEQDQPTYTGKFTSASRLSGTFANGGEGCEEKTWSATPG